ncbi:MAG: hypothetical protein AABZ14_04785, partial [Candidatus Margulisiibacteriota bacterium]
MNALLNREYVRPIGISSGLCKILTMQSHKTRRSKKSLLVWIVVLLIANLVLLFASNLYSFELKQLINLMTNAEKKRLEAISTTQANELALAMEMTRRMDLADGDLHLTVDTKKGLMILSRQGAKLREMKILMGKEGLVGERPDRVRLTLPLGKRQITDIVDETYAWKAPAWVYSQLGQKAISGDALVGALGPLAIFLDSGTIIYASPSKGPLQRETYILPGSIRMA